MKHVFITHSNITKLVCTAIIQRLKIPKDDILILSNRGSIIEGYKNLDIQPSLQFFKGKLRMPKKRKNWLIPIYLKQVYTNYRKIDEFIGINDEYILYTPHVFIDYYQVLASNMNCKQINFIEEGTLNYYPSPKHINRTKLKQIIWDSVYKKRIPSKGFFDANSFKIENSPKYYAILDMAFRDRQNRELLPMAEIKNISIPDNASILILGPLYDFGEMSLDEFSDIIHSFIKDTIGSKSLYLKFHPRQKESVKELTLSIFKNNKISINIIEPNIIMENEFLVERDNKLFIYGVVSSLLPIAKLGNHYVKSYLGKLKYNNSDALDLFRSMGIEIEESTETDKD